MKRMNTFKLSKFALSPMGILVAYGLAVALFFLLRAGGAVDPVLLKLGGFQLRWYGLVVTGAILGGALVAQYLAERRGDNPDLIWVMLVIALVTGLIGARLWYVAFTWENYKDALFSFGDARQAGVFEVWRGGLALHGGMLGATIGLLIFCLIMRLNFWRFSDYGAVGLALAVAVGRWGNFFNNEAYGRETKLFWGIKIPCEFRTSGLTPGTVDLRCPPVNLNGLSQDAVFHPAFLYESLWTYACFLVIFWVVMKPKTFERRFKLRPRNGDVFLLFLVLYSVGRFFIEGYRTDSLYLDGNPNGIRVAQLVSILLILGSGFWFFFRHRLPTPDTEALSIKVATTKPAEEDKQPTPEGLE
jgi:phosphatidylglycerol:prolipoprotein diacylglycerol transferase